MREKGAPWLQRLKDKHFPHVDPDGPPIVLHRSDFVAAKKEFHTLSDEARMASFIADLMLYLTAVEHCVMTVVLDKEAMLHKAYWSNKEPYHYCAEVLAEKFVQYLERRNGVGDVFAESRQHRKNNALAAAFRGVCEAGTRYVSDPARFAERLNTFEIKFRDKKDNVAGLQIADIYAKPSFDRVMFERDRTHERKPLSAAIGELLYEKKYDRSAGTGARMGYGMKYLP